MQKYFLWNFFFFFFELNISFSFFFFFRLKVTVNQNLLSGDPLLNIDVFFETIASRLSEDHFTCLRGIFTAFKLYRRAERFIHLTNLNPDFFFFSKKKIKTKKNSFQASKISSFSSYSWISEDLVEFCNSKVINFK